jgi:hypothetical protein
MKIGKNKKIVDFCKDFEFSMLLLVERRKNGEKV